MYKILAIAIAILLGFQISVAGENEDIAKIQERIDKVANQQPDSIKPSAIKGLYEVIFGAEVFYFSADGRYIFEGRLMDMETNTNLTDAALNSVRKKALAELDESKMIVFSPNKPRHIITVFTDIDCTYCRKLHAEMQELNSYGVAIRYMFFPRSGPNTPSFQKAVNVWCAEDQLDAMTKAKAGQKVEQVSCDNPVSDQFIAAQKMGVTGTPALLFDDGTLLPGYKPAKELAAQLDQMNQQ